MEIREYSGVSKSFHWVIALLIFTLFPLAWVMDDFEGIQKFQAYNIHKSLGLTVLSLMALRLIWRIARSSPSLPESMPKVERLAAQAGHTALYLALFLMPLSGWAMTSASDKPSMLFNIWALPRLDTVIDFRDITAPHLVQLSGLDAESRKAIGGFYRNMHGVMANVLMILIGIHIAAALRHGILLRDGVLSRMLPSFARSKGAKQITASIAFVTAIFAFTQAQSARAAEWGVNPQKSQIAFEAGGSGYNAKGTFGQYRTEIEFDPETPEQATVRVSLNMQSATTGTSDVDSTLKSADFFDPAQYPTAEFTARGAKPSGKGKYVLDGKLTLKGVTKPISVPFDISIQSGTATVKGETIINRLDFGVGPETVAGMAIDKSVKLTIDLTAMRLDN